MKMPDYDRMKRHVRYRRIAIICILVCFVLGSGEAYEAIEYHFPWWDDLGGAVTFFAMLAARFVVKKTDMYSGVD